MLPSLRRKLYVQLHPPAWPGKGLSPLNAALVAAILVGAALAILETEPLISRGRERAFKAVEMTLGFIFAAELALRVWTIAEDRGGEGPARRRLRYLLTPASLIDLAAVLATLIPFIGVNALALRLVRLLRILRLARLGRFSSAMRLVVSAVVSRRFELVLTTGLAATVLVFGATALYWAEGDLQPEKFGSIPRALWWAVVTLTTIGYGDVYPITPLGKLIAAAVAVAGIGLIALPTGILAAAFSEAVQRNRRGADGRPAEGTHSCDSDDSNADAPKLPLDGP